jgi:hypothetical protein
MNGNVFVPLRILGFLGSGLIVNIWFVAVTIRIGGGVLDMKNAIIGVT